MIRWVRICFAIGLLAITGWIAWEVLWPHEPVYQGKSLSVWLEGYVTRESNPVPLAKGHKVASFTENSESDEAARQIGTNAIPTLLKMLGRRIQN